MKGAAQLRFKLGRPKRRNRWGGRREGAGRPRKEGMKGPGVRIARFMNRIMKRSGRVLVDRYHEHILKTPTEVRNARHYLLNNVEKHYGIPGPDHLAPVRPLYVPQTHMLRLQ